MIFACWNVLCQLAPWMLLGMFLSGMLHVFLPAGFIRRKFHGFSGVVKAVLLGVPLPLCSCGVVPAGIGLKNQGASNGAAVGFLISTPQTGIDSILVSASFFGWPFAIFKMVTASVTGVVGGWLVEGAAAESTPPTIEQSESPGKLQILNEHECGSDSHAVHSHTLDDLDQPAFLRVWFHGVEIFRSIWIWLLVGVLISAGIESYIPQQWFEVVGAWGLIPSMFLVLLVATPLYVCATASVPIAAALVTGGLPPAAALVFLMAGPATNVTTMGAIHGRFGLRTLVVYLATIVLGSMAFAWMFDWLLSADVSATSGHVHDHENWWSILSAILLLLMVGYFVTGSVVARFRRRTQRSQLGSDSSQAELQIEGMTCGGCVSKLESAINKLAGVEFVEVELKSGKATVVGDSQLAEVQATIRRLGFQVVQVGSGETQLETAGDSVQ